MTRRLTIAEAKAALAPLGVTTFEQRGFYSHFLRLRNNKLETLATPDVKRGTVPARAVRRVMERAR